MKSTKAQLRHALFGSLALAVCGIAGGAQAAGDQARAARHGFGSPGLVDVVRESVAQYADVAAAQQAGYGLFLGCVSDHSEGAMGVHYANGALVGDPALDPTRPEALVYEPLPNGQLRLVAVEYLVIADAWHAGNTTPPVLMGQSFHYTGSPNRYGLPAFYALHVWAFKPNPHGAFVDWNPLVSCEHYSGASS